MPVTLAIVGGPDVNLRLDVVNQLRQEFRIIVFGSESDQAAAFRDIAVDFCAYPLSRSAHPGHDLRTIWFLYRRFRELNVQLVHTYDTKPCVLGRIAARMAGIQVVTGTITGMGSLYLSEDWKTRLIRTVYEKLQGFACTISDQTVFFNDDDRRHYVDSGLVAPHKTRIIRGSGISLATFDRAHIAPETVSQLRREFGVMHSGLLVTMIGRVIRTKGVMEFAHAAEALASDSPDAVFILVGDEDTDSLDRLRPDEMARIDAHVKRVGRRSDVAAVLAASDIFVLPSYREGIPRVLLEASAMELPIVATDVPGCREVVQDRVNGLLVPARDPLALTRAIRDLVNDQDLRKRFGAEARQLVMRDFETGVIASQMSSLFRELLQGKSP